MHANWARARLDDLEGGKTGLQEALAAYLGRGNKLHAPLFRGRLAEFEAEGDDEDAPLRRIDEALALANETGERWTDALLHRIRGEILLKRDPANSAPAEEAFQTAIAIAQGQKARSFELQAALALAKLYQSTGRAAEAHAVLAPALEGFRALSLLPSGRKPAPSAARGAGDEGTRVSVEAADALTPDPSPDPREERGDAAFVEMPELREAVALLSALADSDEVKAEAAQRQRRGQLQVAYGNALIAARGFGAPETTQAFIRARESATGEKDAPARLAADFGLWAGSYSRGELPSMRAHAGAFLADTDAKPDSPEAGVAHRVRGITHWFAGEFLEARDHLERALARFEPGRDDDLAYRFGMDPGVPAMAYLAFTSWSLGETDRAVLLIERARERVASLTHANTLALGAMHAAFFELMRGDRPRARTDASELARIVREHDLRLFRAFGVFLEGWFTADSGALPDGLAGMRRGAENLREQNAPLFDGLIKITLSEAEARAGDLDRALADLDDGLATTELLGFRAFEAELRRTRGELLLKLGPASPSSAEQEFQAAVAVARRQGARSFELRAALSLAKLYQSTGRRADARAVLAPALEGFAPTPEMPEIAEAQALWVRSTEAALIGRKL
jgi:predicted ATPase